MKFIHKFQQKIDILKTKEKLKIVRDTICPVESCIACNNFLETSFFQYFV